MEERKARWVLRVGRQILVAGFLASSAPVVLPPLVLVSVIGISVSMPYGLFLASHACTQKLMSKLLPMPMPIPPAPTPTPTPPNVLEDHPIDADHINIQEKQTTKGSENGEGVVNEDGSVEHYIREEEKASPPEVQVVITIEGTDKTANNIIEEFEVTNTVALEEFGDEDMELEKETEGLLETIRDEGKSDTRDRVRIGIDPIGDEKKEDPEVSERKKEVADRSTIESRKPIPRVENAEESGFDLFDETSIDLQDYTCTSGFHEESSNTMELAVSEYSSARDINEVMLNEDKLWKEINAIRQIVGYEGTPKASCIEELKNLYIVTGVEPPTLLNDSCNLLEINDKLHFLMSILGIKSNVL